MGQNVTLEVLAQYLYNETDSMKREEVEKALQQDWALREKFAVMQEAAKRIDKMPLFSPRRQTIDAILQYAASKNKTVTQHR